jgi:hypothetical protein
VKKKKLAVGKLREGILVLKDFFYVVLQSCEQSVMMMLLSEAKCSSGRKKNVGMKKKLDRLRLDFLAGSVEPAKNRLMDRRRLATITVNRQKQRMGSISLSCLNN